MTIMRIAFTRDNSWSTNGFIGSSANHPNPMAKEIFNAKIEKTFIYMVVFYHAKSQWPPEITNTYFSILILNLISRKIQNCFLLFANPSRLKQHTNPHQQQHHQQQCDQIGQFSLTLGKFLEPLATIDSPKSPTFLGTFCKDVKIYHFSSEVIFGQLL